MFKGQKQQYKYVAENVWNAIKRHYPNCQMNVVRGDAPQCTKCTNDSHHEKQSQKLAKDWSHDQTIDKHTRELLNKARQSSGYPREADRILEDAMANDDDPVQTTTLHLVSREDMEAWRLKVRRHTHARPPVERSETSCVGVARLAWRAVLEHAVERTASIPLFTECGLFTHCVRAPPLTLMSQVELAKGGTLEHFPEAQDVGSVEHPWMTCNCEQKLAMIPERLIDCLVQGKTPKPVDSPELPLESIERKVELLTTREFEAVNKR